MSCWGAKYPHARAMADFSTSHSNAGLSRVDDKNVLLLRQLLEDVVNTRGYLLVNIHGYHLVYPKCRSTGMVQLI